MENYERLLCVKEVAKLLGVCNHTIRLWDKPGMLPAIRLPSGHRRYRLADVEKRLEKITKDFSK